MEESNCTNLYGRLMLSIDGTSLSSLEKKLISNPHVGGVIFFSRNFISKDQILDLCKEIRSIKENIVISVDQEGGRVQRFQDGFTRIPSMQSLGDFCIRNDNFDFCREVGWLMSAELIASGIDISFAPVLDLDRDTSSIIGNRAFSENCDVVTKLASSFIDGMNEAGMQAIGKHFPGHGGVIEDSHLIEPVDNRSYDELLINDLKPFVDLKSKLSGIMSAHILYPNINNLLVGFSPFWLKEILRDQIQFKGVIFSDDLSMKGAGDENFAHKAQKSIDAGCDMVLVCNNTNASIEVIEFLESQNYDLIESLSFLKKSNNYQWDQLEKDSRRAEIQKTIKVIERRV